MTFERWGLIAQEMDVTSDQRSWLGALRHCVHAHTRPDHSTLSASISVRNTVVDRLCIASKQKHLGFGAVGLAAITAPSGGAYGLEIKNQARKQAKGGIGPVFTIEAAKRIFSAHFIWKPIWKADRSLRSSRTSCDGGRRCRSIPRCMLLQVTIAGNSCLYNSVLDIYPLSFH